MAFNWWMDKLTVIYPYSGILLSNKKEGTISTQNGMHESQMHYAKWKKPHSKSYIVYVCVYMKFWKRQNYMDRKQIWLLPGTGSGGGADYKGAW